MRWLVSPSEMRSAEQEYFQKSGVRFIDVMERAAQALADAISGELPAGATVYFACGTGGNGGDGTACARLLRGRYRCAIVQPSPPKSPDAIENLARARDCGVPVYDRADGLPRPDAWVDALFGTGLSRAPSGAEAALIRRINADAQAGAPSVKRARVYAADIPSGLNGRTGRAYSPCVRADKTVAFQYLKTGLALADGLDAAGEAVAADVGFPGFPRERFDAGLLDASDVVRLLPPRPRNCHKGMCGRLLIVAGSLGMAGAAAMCALAALRSGAGLVTVACPASIVPVLQAVAPQAMCVPLDERDGAIAASALPALREALRDKDAAVVGCGLSRRAAPEAVRAVLESGLPAVIDADALNLMSEHPELLERLRPCHVLTPHPGEARRLLRAAARKENAAAGRAPAAKAAAAQDDSRALQISLPVPEPRRPAKDDALGALLDDPAAAARASDALSDGTDTITRALGALSGDTAAQDARASESTPPQPETCSPAEGAALGALLDDPIAAARALGALSGDPDTVTRALGALSDPIAAQNARVSESTPPQPETCPPTEGAALSALSGTPAARDARVSESAPPHTEICRPAEDDALGALLGNPVAAARALGALSGGTDTITQALDSLSGDTAAQDARTSKSASPQPETCPPTEGAALSALLDDPIAAARALGALGATALYKGASCVICGARAEDGGSAPETYVSASGCCGMARGGSGDILSGILGALLAERSGRSAAQSAALASELHGLAGERAQARYGARAMNARDILEFLPDAFPG